MVKLKKMWREKEGKRLIISIAIAAAAVLALIGFAVFTAVADYITLGYRLLMMAPCLLYGGVVGRLLYGEVIRYKSSKSKVSE